MTKNELYNALLDEGENLPPIDKIKKADLEALYAQRHPEETEAEAEQEQEPEKAADNDRPQDALEQQDAESAAEAEPEAEQEPPAEETEAVAPVAPVDLPPLHFSGAGWCEALQRSYFVGWFQPASLAEYEALAPYADGACND